MVKHIPLINLLFLDICGKTLMILGHCGRTLFQKIYLKLSFFLKDKNDIHKFD